MAKIKITESELKELIRESVENVINEGNFGMNWNQLSEPEKQKFTNRYYNWNVGNFLKNGFNKQAIDPADVERRYQEIQTRKQKNGNAKFSQAQGQRLQQQVAALTKSAQMADISFGNIEKSLDDLIATTQPKQKPLKEAESAQSVYTDTSTTDAQGNTNTTRTYNDNYNFKQRGDNIAAKVQTLKTNVETMKAALDKANASMGQLTKANQTLTAQNKNLTAQAQAWQKRAQTPQVPTTQSKLPTGQAVAQAPQGGLAPLKPNTAQA